MMQLMQVLNDATIEERNHRTTLPMNHFRLGFQQFLTIDDEKTLARGFHTAT